MLHQLSAPAAFLHKELQFATDGDRFWSDWGQVKYCPWDTKHFRFPQVLTKPQLHDCLSVPEFHFGRTAHWSANSDRCWWVFPRCNGQVVKKFIKDQQEVNHQWGVPRRVFKHDHWPGMPACEWKNWALFVDQTWNKEQKDNLPGIGRVHKRGNSGRR